MILGIRQPEMAYADASIEILRYEDGWGVPGGYSLQQRQLILDFLQLMRARNGANKIKTWKKHGISALMLRPKANNKNPNKTSRDNRYQLFRFDDVI